VLTVCCRIFFALHARYVILFSALDGSAESLIVLGSSMEINSFLPAPGLPLVRLASSPKPTMHCATAQPMDLNPVPPSMSPAHSTTYPTTSPMLPCSYESAHHTVPLPTHPASSNIANPIAGDKGDCDGNNNGSNSKTYTILLAQHQPLSFNYSNIPDLTKSSHLPMTFHA